ncbi:MAG TPA: quinone-dependent dihydroorotate dehydrogenase [Candidatus Binataceae bacterium]|nr:quinone-dependent dihydroorotate dehydrogenase [Candidatus Binataceae bacterium]
MPLTGDKIVQPEIYQRLIRPILFRFDAEAVHRLTLAILSRWPARQPIVDSPQLAVNLFGLRFANPVGLAAGMDKDARAIAAWQSLGFGFAELGTITPQAQPGNPRPRICRLPNHGAMINRLGFPSEGMEVVARRIKAVRRRKLGMRLALNFGPNKETPPEKIAADYAALMARCGSLADFVVVNLSSPNTPGLRDWQAPERIRTIVEALRTAELPEALRPRTPLVMKIAPDLELPVIDEIAATALGLKIDGIVATNSTIKRAEVGVTSPYQGGLSGQPLTNLARGLIARVYRATGGKLPIIGVGGIASAEDAWGHIRAGASLVEFYTGMIYQGPGLAASIKMGLRQLLARHGCRSISEVVGADV